MGTVIDFATRTVIAEPAARVPAPPAVAVGCTVEVGSLRIHRYADSFTVHDLTNAGKRGKKVDHFSVGFWAARPEVVHVMDMIVNTFVAVPDYATSLAYAKESVSRLKVAGVPCLEIHESVSRGVDILPASSEKIVIEGDLVRIEADEHEFSVRCRADKFNEPTAINPTRGGRTAGKAFYAFARDNKAALKGMAFRDVLAALMEKGIGFHDYCAMD